MDADHRLYRVGTDGRTIPDKTAVVIIAAPAALTSVTTQSGTIAIGLTNVTASVNGTNILQSSNTAQTVSGFSGTPYVLGVVNNVLGFYPYTGTIIPANKAYYVQ